MAVRKDFEKDKTRFLKIFGEHVRVLREMRELTIQDLANLCEVPRSTLSRIEHGKQNPTVFFLLRLAEALEVSLSDLFEKIEERF